MATRPKVTKLTDGTYNIDWSNVDGESDFFNYTYEKPKELVCDCGASKVVGYAGFDREHALWCELIKDN